MLLSFSPILTKSLSGQQETTWHFMRINLSTYVTFPTNVILSMNFLYTTSTGTILTPVDQLRDLGITVSSDSSWTSHIRSSCNKARKMAAWVFSVFHSRNTGVMLTLYKSLVRSLLEYCSPLIQELESVQRTFTSKIRGLQHLHYWDRLKTLSVMSLQRRRERYIVMHMWKILHGFTSNDLEVQSTVNPRLGTLAKVPA